MKKSNLTFYFFLIVSLWVGISASAQRQVNFSGPFEVSDNVGIAEFEFQFLQGDSVLNGPFKFYSGGVDSLVSTQGTFFYYQGQFETGVPSGPWKFQFGQLRGDQELLLIDNQLQSTVTGRYHQMTGEIKSGEFQGEWVSEISDLRKSVVDRQVFRSRFQFEQSIPLRSFSIETEDVSLMGRYLRDGLAHDIWELFSDEINDTAEEWHFSDGWLQEIKYFTEGEEESLAVFQVGKEDSSAIVNLDDRYIKTLNAKLFLEGLKEDQLSEDDIFGLLTESASHYEQINTILSPISTKESHIPLSKVKVQFFPITGEEETELAEIRANYENGIAQIERLLENKQLKIIRLSDTTLDATLEQLREVRDSGLQPIQTILTFEKDSILSYLDRDSLVTSLWTADVATNTQEQNLTGVLNLSRMSLKELESIGNSLDEQIMFRVREDELEELEATLVDRLEQLNLMLDSIIAESEGDVQAALISIKLNANGPLTDEYSQLTGQSRREDFLTRTIDCLEDVSELSTAVAQIPAQQDELIELYTDEVWNPFTATLMSELVKRRIVEGYSEIVIPYLLKQVNEQDCRTAGSNHILLQNLHQRMQEMRNEETKRIERRLKKTTEPEDILKIFEVSSTQSVPES